MAGSVVFLLIFIVCTVLVYFGIRRRWGQAGPIAAVGGVVNSLAFMMFSLARGNVFGQALVIGLVFGIIFTASVVSVAVFFAKNPAEM